MTRQTHVTPCGCQFEGIRATPKVAQKLPWDKERSVKQCIPERQDPFQTWTHIVRLGTYELVRTRHRTWWRAKASAAAKHRDLTLWGARKHQTELFFSAPKRGQAREKRANPGPNGALKSGPFRPTSSGSSFCRRQNGGRPGRKKTKSGPG